MGYFFAAFMALIMSAPLLNANEEIHWITNFQEAKEIGKRESKPLLIFFNGSDWSGWGMKMKKEVLDDPQFISKIKDKFVFLEIDLPQHHALEPELEQQNVFLREEFGVAEVPRVILQNENGKEIARLGYSPGSGNQFADDLLKIVKKDADLTQTMVSFFERQHTPQELQVLYQDALELQREEDAEIILDCGLFCKDPVFFLLEKYRLLVEAGKGEDNLAIQLREKLLSIDPENKKGLQFSLALIRFYEMAAGEKEIKNLNEVVLPLEEYLLKFKDTDLENAWRVEMMIAQYYFDADEAKTALKYAENAFQSAPIEKKKEIAHSLEYIRKQADLVVQSDP